LAERAGAIGRTGHSAIVDAVYARADERAALERAAAAAGVPFAGLWLEAPDAALIARVEQRRHDASDADASVIRLQRAVDAGEIRWHRIDASATPDAVLRSALSSLQVPAALDPAV
jgi:uncharacterized protein